MNNFAKKSLNIFLSLMLVFFAGCFVVVNTYSIIDWAIPIWRAEPPWMFYFLGALFPFSLPCISTFVLLRHKEKKLLPMIFGLAAVAVGAAMCIHCLIELPELIETSKTSDNCLSAALYYYGATKVVNYSTFNFALFALMALEIMCSRFQTNTITKKNIRITIYSLVGIHIIVHILSMFFDSLNSIGLFVFGGIFMFLNVFAVAILLIILAVNNKKGGFAAPLV